MRISITKFLFFFFKTEIASFNLIIFKRIALKKMITLLIIWKIIIYAENKTKIFSKQKLDLLSIFQKSNSIKFISINNFSKVF